MSGIISASQSHDVMDVDGLGVVLRRDTLSASEAEALVAPFKALDGAGVEACFAGSVADDLFRLVGDLARHDAADVLGGGLSADEVAALSCYLRCCKALAGAAGGLALVAASPRRGRRRGLGGTDAGACTQALELLAVLAVSGDAGYDAALGALEDLAAARATAPPRPRRAPRRRRWARVRRDVMLFVNTLVNGAPSLERRVAVRADLVAAGLAACPLSRAAGRAAFGAVARAAAAVVGAPASLDDAGAAIDAPPPERRGRRSPPARRGRGQDRAIEALSDRAAAAARSDAVAADSPASPRAAAAARAARHGRRARRGLLPPPRAGRGPRYAKRAPTASTRGPSAAPRQGGAWRQGASGAKAPAAPARPNPAPRVPMRALFWSKIDAAAASATVWRNLSDAGLDVDAGAGATSARSARARASEAPSGDGAAAGKRVGLVDARTAQNVAIALAKLRAAPAVRRPSSRATSVLPPHKMELVLGAAPSAEDAAACAEFRGDESRLEPCEAFFQRSAPCGPRARLEGLVLAHRFDAAAEASTAGSGP
ncbi:hypothetical protein JL722_12973 [Aureococcus anophagefferens]|nr:hypothetical protein JL722_12973 [Aureococcus anophagefferens]